MESSVAFNVVSIDWEKSCVENKINANKIVCLMLANVTLKLVIYPTKFGLRIFSIQRVSITYFTASIYSSCNTIAGRTVVASRLG